MPAFQLTETALRDIDSILAYLVDEAGDAPAYRLRAQMFETFARLAEYPGMGHLRRDLTRKPLSFFPVDPYLVIFDGASQPITIHAVLHGARDVKQILRRRP